MITSYTSTVRYENFLKLCGKQIPQKIVLVSDFINQFGGIETYLHEVKSLLESQGHHVLLRGGRMPKGSLGRIKMWRGLITAPVNVWSAWSFKHFLKKEKPDLIRFHSLLRNLGPNVVRVAQGEKIKTWMMYHDLGYFTPYPSKISAVSEIHTPLTLQHFLANVKGRIINKIAVFCKYFWLKKLIRVLKAAVDLHLVPSAFMEPFVVQGRGIPEKHVKVLPHFLQK
jgi:glycosyltransferase involved in cell wall biosynthesis